MQIFYWQFKPGLWPTIAFLLLFPLLLRLGFWQLDRAEQKENLQEQYRSRSTGSRVVDLNKESVSPEQMIWQQSIARGNFDKENIFFLDNQVMRGQAGYLVYVPFSLAGGKQKILVNYGWVPLGDDRTRLPTLVLPQESLTIKGVTKTVPATGIKLAKTPMENLGKGLYRVQDVDLKKIANDRGWELLPYILRLSSPTPDGILREWVKPGFGKEKHLGYAFQWFALATALLIIYLAVNVERKEEDEH